MSRLNARLYNLQSAVFPNFWFRFVFFAWHRMQGGIMFVLKNLKFLSF